MKWQNVAPLNGRPMTSADIKCAFDRYSAEGVHKSYWRNISHTETPDATTFIATMGSVTDLIEDLVYDNLATTLPLHPWVFVFDERPAQDSGLLGPWVGRTDPAEAQKLLKAAGAEGLDFGAIYYRYGDYVQEQTEIILKNFADVGLNMDARSVDYTEFNSTWARASSRRRAPRRG